MFKPRKERIYSTVLARSTPAENINFPTSKKPSEKFKLRYRGDWPSQSEKSPLRTEAPPRSAREKSERLHPSTLGASLLLPFVLRSSQAAAFFSVLRRKLGDSPHPTIPDSWEEPSPRTPCLLRKATPSETKDRKVYSLPIHPLLKWVREFVPSAANKQEGRGGRNQRGSVLHELIDIILVMTKCNRKLVFTGI
ncbi:hypothetical protein C8J57DRAFT_1231145 [Mycena rebaudengoi]|nr:hypothetical protein C8J57DRAFT_1231145 [Mycena rebaudengoi]